ncbi:MAG TPA: hypothetical protein VFQ38_19535 [Longimicrobiales bacterium]|nr:hypothetical protein [Longimicrobiales bacterium]
MSRPDIQTERGAARAAPASATGRVESRSTRHGVPANSAPAAGAGRTGRRRVATVLLLATLASACARGGAREPSPSEEPQRLSFQNSTIDQLSLYLVGDGSEWLLGRVEPGRTVQLRLPPGFPEARAGLFSLVAVPLGARDPLNRDVASNPAAIQSMPEPAQNLVKLRWLLVARQLVSLVPADVAPAAARVR